MGAAGNLRTHQGIFRSEGRCVYLFQGISSQIIIAVAAGGVEAGFADPVGLHGVDHLQLIILCSLSDLLKTVCQGAENLLAEFPHLLSDPQFFIHGAQ